MLSFGWLTKKKAVSHNRILEIGSVQLLTRELALMKPFLRSTQPTSNKAKRNLLGALPTSNLQPPTPTSANQPHSPNTHSLTHTPTHAKRVVARV
jgi:hypothetical protein